MGPIVPHQSEHVLYRPDIDGLRALAVVTVVLFHAFPTYVPGGFVGVDVFFVISGYLITTIILKPLARGSFSFLDFYKRRAVRLFPALAVVLALCLLAGRYALFPHEYVALSKHVVGSALYALNFILMGEQGYFDVSLRFKPLAHIWSLAVEEQIYLIWPLLLVALSKLIKSRLIFFLAITLFFVLSFEANLAISFFDPTSAYYSPYTRAWQFLAGALISPSVLAQSPTVPRFLRFDVSADFRSVLGLALVLVSCAFLSDGVPYPSWYGVVPTIGAMFLITSANSWINRIWLSNRPVVFVGLISYPFYLCHWPVLSFLRIIEGDEPPIVVRMVAIAAAFMLACLIFIFIEKPVRAGKENIKLVLLPTGAVLSLAIIAAAVSLRGGMATPPYLLPLAEAHKQFVGPLWKYSQDEDCLKRFPFPSAQEYPWWFCKVSGPASPTTIILGSSFANQLYPGLANNPQLRHHTFLSIGTCSPEQVDRGYDNPTRDTPCSGSRQWEQQQFLDELIASTPSLRYVVLAGLPTSLGNEAAQNLERRVASLEEKGLRIILFAPHVQPTFDTRRCFNRRFGASSTCDVPIEARQQIDRGYKSFIDALSSSHPAVKFFDGNDLFCTPEKCHVAVDGMPLYRDEFFHISEFASDRLGVIFITWAKQNLPDFLKAREAGRG